MTKPEPDADGTPATQRSVVRRRPKLSWRQRRADRREVERTLADLEIAHVGELQGHLVDLAAHAAVVARITLLENRPSIRLLQIDFDAEGPSLLAAVSDASVAAIAAVRLPALICFRRGAHHAGRWVLELVTLEETIHVTADVLVTVDGYHPACSEGTD
jgi:hypothetical protein